MNRLPCPPANRLPCLIRHPRANPLHLFAAACRDGITTCSQPATVDEQSDAIPSLTDSALYLLLPSHPTSLEPVKVAIT
jgi:hypothetical protein